MDMFLVANNCLQLVAVLKDGNAEAVQALYVNTLSAMVMI
jgi:hypothetical protein